MLLKKLIEVEIDGQAAQQHVHQLRDVIRRLREDNHLAMTSAESVALAKLKEAFFEKMADFEAANRTLRRLLRAQRQSEGEVIWLTEQQDALLHKVADTEAINEVSRSSGLLWYLYLLMRQVFQWLHHLISNHSTIVW